MRPVCHAVAVYDAAHDSWMTRRWPLCCSPHAHVGHSREYQMWVMTGRHPWGALGMWRHTSFAINHRIMHVAHPSSPSQ